MKKEISVTFEVAMDIEAKKAKDTHKVKFVLDIPDEAHDQILADAVAHQIVKFQQQIRSNWDTFIQAGVPERVTYGQPLYGRRTPVRPPTEAEVAAVISKKIAQLTPEGIAEFAATGKIPEDPKFYK